MCVNKIDVTNIGRQHDLTELLRVTEDIEIDSSALRVDGVGETGKEDSGDIAL